MIEVRPIKTWPDGWRDPNRERRYSRFDSSWTSTTRLLTREVDQLGATSWFVQLDIRDRDVRRDGALRADVKVNHPGVILTIDTVEHGTLTYACDAFVGYGGKVAWQENLRAIALGLEALRKVERYGIADRGQQYAGYRELGSGIPLGAAGPMSKPDAARILADAAGWSGPDVDSILTNPDVARAAWREAVKLHHPDTGEAGDSAAFQLITDAWTVLDA